MSQQSNSPAPLGWATNSLVWDLGMARAALEVANAKNRHLGLQLVSLNDSGTSSLSWFGLRALNLLDPGCLQNLL